MKVLEVWFQFPSNGKTYPKKLVFISSSAAIQPFQFPSNGKAYPKFADTLIPPKTFEFEFRFPSNGKAYPKYMLNRWHVEEVSAFRFPSNGKSHSKGKIYVAASSRHYKFQFPSNGKSHSKYGLGVRDVWAIVVSISFKREITFQDLSSDQLGRRHPSRVSIPFKRENISKANNTYLILCVNNFRFNSLQTGKHIQRANPIYTATR